MINGSARAIIGRVLNDSKRYLVTWSVCPICNYGRYYYGDYGSINFGRFNPLECIRDPLQTTDSELIGLSLKARRARFEELVKRKFPTETAMRTRLWGHTQSDWSRWFLWCLKCVQKSCSRHLKDMCQDEVWSSLIFNADVGHEYEPLPIGIFIIFLSNSVEFSLYF